MNHFSFVENYFLRINGLLRNVVTKNQTLIFLTFIKFLALVTLAKHHWWKLMGNKYTKVESSSKSLNEISGMLLNFRFDKLLCFRRCSDNLASIEPYWWYWLSSFFTTRMNRCSWYFVFSLPLMLSLGQHFYYKAVRLVSKNAVF